jgi:hypothetical protein
MRLLLLMLVLCVYTIVQAGHAAAMSVFCNAELSKAERGKGEVSHLFTSIT